MSEGKKNPFIKEQLKPSGAENGIGALMNGAKDTEERKLTEEVAKEFEMVGHQPGLFIFKGISVDLRKISVEEAGFLVDAKFPYLKKKEAAKKATT